jgi:hypothetical protein
MMSVGGNQALARSVASAIEDWTPSEAYGHESKFQNELQTYLDRRLNADNSMMMRGNRDVVVEREHGNVNGDVVVNGDIGIEMKRNLTNSQTKKLRGQIEEYQKEYTHVIALACGIKDMDGWRKLKNDYENQVGTGMAPDDAPVKFIHKQKVNYGTENTTQNYTDSTGGAQAEAGADELVEIIEDGMKGYQSLTGDGPMDSNEATVAVAKAVFVVGFLLAVTGIILFNFIL